MDFSTPSAAFLRHQAAGKRRGEGSSTRKNSAALLDKSTSVADGEGGGKSPMMRAFKAARCFSLAAAPPCAWRAETSPARG
ncbi:hypothetical protein, partial [Pseudomonas sp. 79_C]|uniref:hypothetical protein n=1 Tax=Pseudomonas sp. 79_C TaxID=2813567 RepID=UPI001A9EAE53